MRPLRFGPEWNHGLRLVARRIIELIVGPRPGVHLHRERELWHLFPIVDPFIKWQRPITDSAFHFDRAGVDLIWLWWTLCLHWIDH